MVMEIESIHNAKVKFWTQLRDKKGRDKHGKFIIEGIHLVQEALLSGYTPDCLIYSRERGMPVEISEWIGSSDDSSERDRHDSSVGDHDHNREDRSSRGSGSEIECYAVSEAVLAKCTDTETPQGICAVINKFSGEMGDFLTRKDALVVVIDGVQDPGNLGTIIRSADAAGASGVLIGKGSVDLYNPKTIRATMGSIFHLPVSECELIAEISQAAEHGVQVISTSPQATQHCYEIDLREPTWLIFGNESRGISAEVSSHVRQSINIPLHGRAESLNVAMAATVLLYEAQRQRKYAAQLN